MRRNSNNSHNIVVSTPASVHKASGLKFSRSSASRKNSSNNTQFSDKDMTPPILTSINQPVSEIKQNVAKRFSLKVSPKIPKFIRSSSSSSTKSRISVSTLNNDNHLINQSDSLNKFSSSPTKLSTELPPQNSPNSLYVARTGNASDVLKSSNEAQDTCSISENWETITQNDYKNSSDERNENNEKNGIDQSLIFTSDPIPNKKHGGAPLLISNIGKTSSSTTKAQKKNVKAGSKSLPRNLFRFIKKDKPPEIVTIPSLSPPSVTYVSPPPTIPQKPKKKRGSHPRSGSFYSTKQTLANALLRRVRNRPVSVSNINEDVLTYTSFPDPDPEDYVNIYTWDLPDSISATEAAGGVLQMIEYD
ncbi:4534_t:CDS:1, partial [Dentiscutata heterogama]